MDNSPTGAKLSSIAQMEAGVPTDNQVSSGGAQVVDIRMLKWIGRSHVRSNKTPPEFVTVSLFQKNDIVWVSNADGTRRSEQHRVTNVLAEENYEVQPITVDNSGSGFVISGSQLSRCE